MLLPRRSGPLEKSIPSAATQWNAPSPGAGAWTFSSWSQIVSSSPFPFLFCGLNEFSTGTWSANVDATHVGLIQIGTGAASSEVVIAEFMKKYSAYLIIDSGASTTQIGHAELKRVPIPILIPTSTRIAGRRANADNTVDLVVGAVLTGYDANDGFPPVVWPYGVPFWNYPMLDGIYKNAYPKVFPSAANGISVTSSTSWVLGSWVTLIASGTLTKPFLLTHVHIPRASSGNTNVVFELQVGLGSTPEPVAAVHIPGRVSVFSPGIGTYELLRPVLCYPGEDVKIAIRGSASETLVVHASILEF